MSGRGEGEGGGGFLSRWSRRKRAAALAPPLPPPVAPAPSEAVQPGAVLPGAAEPALDPASLPPVESLTADSDFAAFLREEVPAALRNAALRRAWSLDPAIRDFVGPADYAWDFNAPGGVPGFSLDLPTDVERLLAQAIGLDASPPEERPEQEAPPLAGIGAPAPVEPGPNEGAPGAPSAVEAHAPEGEPAVEALPGPLADAPPTDPQTARVTDSLPLRRRHGGALPT